jgi:hypothetical protein
MMPVRILVAILCLVRLGLLAQTADEAFSYSQNHQWGTARFTSMSGAFTALGSDPSAINRNPASLGLFRQGLLTVTAGLLSRNNNSTFYSNSTGNRVSYGQMPNLTLVLSGPGSGEFRFVNLGFSFHQTNDLRNTNIFEGGGATISKLDVYLAEVTADPLMFVDEIPGKFPFTAGLAWGAVLLDTAAGVYYNVRGAGPSSQRWDRTIERNTAQYEFSVGANYADNLYLGGAIGFTSLRYATRSAYTETFAANDTSTYLNAYTESDELRVSGSGMYLNVGLIWWIEQWLRVGAAFRGSPSLRLSESFTRNIDADWRDRPATFAQGPEGINQYRFRMPWRLNTGVALVRKDLGVLSIDGEFTEYRHMLFKTDPGLVYDLSPLNTKMSERFVPAWKVAVGVERPWKIYALRAGAFTGRGGDRLSSDRSEYGVSIGGGMRLGQWVIDAAWMNSVMRQQRQMVFELPGTGGVYSELSTINHSLLLTCIYRFD